MERILLVQSDGLVFICDGNNSVSYPSPHELIASLKKLGFDSSVIDEKSINYEPERNLYLKSSNPNRNLPLPDQDMENIINVVGQLNDMKDAFWGMSLEEAKNKAKVLIKIDFQQVIDRGCLTSSGVRYDCDDKDRSNILGALRLMELGNLEQMGFIDWNNDKQMLSYSELVTVGLEVGAYYQQVLYRKNEIYGLIDAAQTIDDVKAITWTMGE